MSRLIDAGELMKAMYHRAFETDGDTMWQSGCWVRYRAIEQVIKEQPTIEPERKAGRWIDEGFYADGHGAHAFRCSECGGHIIEYDADPFCKWCGAKMEGDK